MPSATTRAASRSCSVGILHGEQRPRVPGREHPRRDPTLDGRRELEQPDGVADLWPRTSDPLGELLVGAGEVLEQLAVGRRLLQRVELGAVEVLQEGVAQHVGVLGLAHDRRDRGQPGLLGGPPSTLAHHQLVGLRTRLAHHHRLEQPDLLDRVHELAHRLFLEDLARLHVVGRHLGDREVGEVGTGRHRHGGSGRRVDDGCVRLGGLVLIGGRAGRDQRAEPTTETTAGTVLAHRSSHTGAPSGLWVESSGGTLPGDLTGGLEIGQRAG